MILFKRIEIDLEKEHKRVKAAPYNGRQRRALLKLLDLFEQGLFQECLDHLHNPKAFRHDPRGGWHESEHVGVEIADALCDMGQASYYTECQMLQEAVNALKKISRKHLAKQRAAKAKARKVKGTA